MTRWTAEQIWDFIDAWRWIPPSSTRVTTPDYDLAVTSGSYALTFVYGFSVDDPQQVDERLDELHERIKSHGGTGACLQVTPRSRPPDLEQRLQRHGYHITEDAEALVWELRDADGIIRIPNFTSPPSLTVREVLSEPEFDVFLRLDSTIFGDPPLSDETRAGFLSEFQRKVRDESHSDRFLVWDRTVPIGRAGLELVGAVARLWGTGVLVEHRRRGAYGALVRARCESAARRGAEIALLTARVDTSGPILKRHGFQSVGPFRVFETHW
ncbi:MAG: hypothetical protein ACRECT_06530 [Thermoplasmata archaeon]